MSFAFVCAKEDDFNRPDERHDTTFVMRRCTHCEKNALAGYWCDTCGHDDTDPADALAGHGPGKCVHLPEEPS